MTRKFRSPAFLILACYLFLTAFNINKAFVMDDTFHLEAAQWIADNPARPMSGKILWNQGPPSAIYEGNQPPLYFYLVAATGELFGYDEIPMHLFQSIFTLLLLICFYRTARLYSPNAAPWLLLLLTGCPALVMGQNLMTDVPLLSLLIASFYYLLIAAEKQQVKNYIASALFLTAAILIKYSALPMLIVFGLMILFRKQYRLLWVLAIPVGILIGWAYWNLWEFGHIHMLQRGGNSLGYVLLSFLANLVPFLVLLGALVLLSFFIIKVKAGARASSLLTYLAAGMILLFVLTWKIEMFREITRYTLLFLFLVNGLILVITMIRRIRTEFRRSDRLSDNKKVLYLYLGTFTLFILFLSPFMAARHVMLIIPFVLILLSEYILNSGRYMRYLVTSLTFLAGVAVGLGDLAMAGVYRSYPAQKIVEKEGEVRTVGHWGWQWYSQKQGIQPFRPGETNLKDGDLLLIPDFVADQSLAQRLPDTFYYDEVGIDSVYTPWYAPMETVWLYRYFVPMVPWGPSRELQETFSRVRVRDKSKPGPYRK